jgi:hypothetical protein
VSLLSSASFVAPSAVVAQGTALPEGMPPAFTDHLVLQPGERVHSKLNHERRSQ